MPEILKKSLISFITFLVTLFASPMIINFVCSIKSISHIKGRIVDSKSKKPVFDSEVIIEGTSYSKTDKDGYFVLTCPSTGDFFIGKLLCSACKEDDVVIIQIKSSRMRSVKEEPIPIGLGDENVHLIEVETIN